MTTQPFHLQGNKRPVDTETTATNLLIEGTLPLELNGHYLRNGPNPRATNEHWFTGDGMVHGVQLARGQARWYRNRYVRTESFTDAIPLYGPDGSRNLHSSVANTHVVRHAGTILALVESSLPYEITAELETVGCHDFAGRLDDSMTAHPKICPTTGELHFFGYGNLTEPFVRYHRANAAGELVVDQPVDVPGMTMMHDFALTAEHVVFLDLPVCFDLEIAMAGARLPFRWKPDYGARFGVMRRDDPSIPIRWFDVDPCYVFHVANAFERDGQVVVQAARYPHLWVRGEFDADATMWEWTLDLASGAVKERALDDLACEFPRIDDRLTGLPSRVTYVATDHEVVRYDTESGDRSMHAFGADEPGEATFIPRAGGAEGEGYLMTYVYRAESDTSDLVVLDAENVADDPLASVKLPVRVPSGFHGNWFADEARSAG